jgi:hypothetical protein
LVEAFSGGARSSLQASCNSPRCIYQLRSMPSSELCSSNRRLPKDGSPTH